MTNNFDKEFKKLLKLSNKKVNDISDEHQRLPVYLDIIQTEHWKRVLPLMPDEPEPLIAGDILVRLLEAQDESYFDQLVSLAPVVQLDFVKQRKKDVIVLRKLEQGFETSEIIEVLLEGSDWLQRKAVTTVPIGIALSELSKYGRTKKVRNAAKNRLSVLPFQN